MRRPYKHIDLQDKFSDFEYTPNDSNWENISGGLNPMRAPGHLAEKFSGFLVAPSKEVWNGAATSVNPQGKTRAAAFWLKMSGVAAVFAAFVFSMTISESGVNTAYVPRESNSVQLTSDKFADLAESESKFVAHLYTILSAENVEPEKNSQVLTRDLDVKANNSLLVNEINTNRNQFSQTKDSEPLEQLASAASENSDIDSTIIFKIKRDYLHPIRVTDMSSDHLVSDVEIQPIELNNSWRSSRAKWDYCFSGLLAENTNEVFTNSVLDTGNESALTTDNQISADFSAINSVDEIGFTSAEEFSTPISFSVNGEKSLNLGAKSRMKLGLGLGFLRFKSSVTETSAETEKFSELDRKYVTLPLYLKFNFLTKKKLEAYVKLGSTTELGVSGKRKTTTSENDIKINETSTNFNPGAGQINVNSGIGSEFQLSSMIHAFAEVNLAHYVAETEYTYWSNQKLWPIINTGITLKIRQK